MIKSGEKKEEYREIKPYWTTRFKNYGKQLSNEIVNNYFIPTYIKAIFPVMFRNGYSRNSSTLICNCTLSKGQGKSEWGAEPNKEYYILDILEVLKVK